METKTYSTHTPVGELEKTSNGVRMSDVNTEHPEYKKKLSLWKTIEDCINGEADIKSEKEKYLPRPSAMSRDRDGNLAYTSYITRAHFPDFTSKFLSGLTGITKINPPKVKLPSDLEYLIDDCDGEGTPLEVFFFQSVGQSLRSGRQLVFVDVDQKNNRLKLVRYNAMELINWGVIDKVYNNRDADFFVLKEKVNSSDSIFSHEYEDQFRVISTSDALDNSGSKVFVSTVFDSDGNDIGESSVPTLFGVPFVGIPATIIGSTDITINPDQIPLMGVSSCALQMYMKDADLSNALFLTCNPTLCMSGVSQDENGGTANILVGSNVSITMEDSQARAYYTKTDASGLAEVRLSIRTYLEEAKHAGSALLSGDQKGVESGEALRIKAASTTASLSSVSQTVARGLEKVIRYMAEWTNSDPLKVSISVDTDYLDNMLTPEYINQLVKLFEASIISHETAIDKLKEGRFLDEDVNTDEEIKRVDEEKKEEEVRLAKIEAANMALSKVAEGEDPADAGISDTSREMDEDVEK